MTKNVYVSYAWEPETQQVLSKLEQSAQKINIKLIYDRKTLEYKGNIKWFMDQLSEADFIILIISDQYLKSKYCMYELLGIQHKGNFEQRTFPIFLSSAKIKEPTDILNYSRYWQSKMDSIDQELKTIFSALFQELRSEIELYNQIYKQIAKLAFKLNENIVINNAPNESFDVILREIEQAPNHKTENELFKQSPEKYTDELYRETDILASLAKWMRKHKAKIIRETCEKFFLEKHLIHRCIKSKKDEESFKKTILTHLNWVEDGFETLLSDTPLENFVKPSDINPLCRDAYHEYFSALYNKIDNEFSELRIAHDELPFILDALTVLRDRYK